MEFSGWTGVEVQSAIDSPAIYRLSAPSLPEDAQFRVRFRPFTYPAVEVTLDGDPLITAVQVNVLPEATESQFSVVSEGMSPPGLLADLCMPASAYPLQVDNLKLSQIARKLCEPFGVTVAPVENEGAPFVRVKTERDASPLSVLMRLAQLRGLVLSSTPEGELLFQRSVDPGNPRFSLSEGDSPQGGVRPSFNAQSYFSEIVGVQSSAPGTVGKVETEQNAFLQNVVRPHCFELDDAEDSDLPTAVKAKLGRMLSNAASYAIALPGWRDPTGALFAPNTTMLMRAPRAMIYTQTEFLIRSVRLRADAHERSAELELVLPGAFSGQLPQELPWAG